MRFIYQIRHISIVNRHSRSLPGLWQFFCIRARTKHQKQPSLTLTHSHFMLCSILVRTLPASSPPHRCRDSAPQWIRFGVLKTYSHAQRVSSTPLTPFQFPIQYACTWMYVYVFRCTTYGTQHTASPQYGCVLCRLIALLLYQAFSQKPLEQYCFS